MLLLLGIPPKFILVYLAHLGWTASMKPVDLSRCENWSWQSRRGPVDLKEVGPIESHFN